jgi:hypothetical protein
VAQDEEPSERCGAAGTRGAVALASANPSLHGSAQMENPTKTSTATADSDNRNRGHVELVAPAVVVPLRFSDLMISRRPREEQSLADQGFGRFCSRERSQDGHRGSLSR